MARFAYSANKNNFIQIIINDNKLFSSKIFRVLLHFISDKHLALSVFINEPNKNVSFVGTNTSVSHYCVFELNSFPFLDALLFGMLLFVVVVVVVVASISIQFKIRQNPKINFRMSFLGDFIAGMEVFDVLNDEWCVRHQH